MRTDATSPHDIATEFVADIIDATLSKFEGPIDGDVLSRNKIRLPSRFASRIYVEPKDDGEQTIDGLKRRRL